MSISDSLSGRVATELRDYGLGPNSAFTRCRALDGSIVSGFGTDGYTYCKGVNGLYYGSASLAISSAQILALHSTPLVLVPASGANTINIIQELVLHYVPGLTGYTTGSQNIGVYYDSLPGTPISLTNTLGFLTQTTAQMANPVIQSNLTIPDANCVNQPIWIYTTVSDPTGGDGTVKVFAKYYTFNLGSQL